jgi:uncharacterized YigZ family protein
MTAFSYLTIRESTEGLFKDKGSKFLAFTFPVASIHEVRDKIDFLKKEYFDARHHCYAWMLGVEKTNFRAFDDGEPNHSAGDPILGQIRSRGITDILVVVVRYFGGTKLGVGGLISAYKTAAEDALNKAVIVEREITSIVKLKYAYGATPEVMRLVKEFELEIVQQDFQHDCLLEFKVKLRAETALLEKIKLLHATGHHIAVIIGKNPYTIFTVQGQV